MCPCAGVRLARRPRLVVASDVDLHCPGINADTHMIDQLVNDTRFDAVSAPLVRRTARYR